MADRRLHPGWAGASDAHAQQAPGERQRAKGCAAHPRRPSVNPYLKFSMKTISSMFLWLAALMCFPATATACTPAGKFTPYTVEQLYNIAAHVVYAEGGELVHSPNGERITVKVLEHFKGPQLDSVPAYESSCDRQPQIGVAGVHFLDPNGRGARDGVSERPERGADPGIVAPHQSRRRCRQDARHSAITATGRHPLQQMSTWRTCPPVPLSACLLSSRETARCHGFRLCVPGTRSPA